MNATSAASSGEISLPNRSASLSPFQIVRSKRRTIALVIDAEARLIVRAPSKTPDSFIDKLIREKQNWILRKQKEQKTKISLIPIPKFTAGEEFLFLGCMSALPGTDITDKQKLIAWYRTQARSIISEKVAKYADDIGVKHTRIRITGARKRWGSCSVKGSLSFTWRLILTPPDVIDYVIVHELMHLRVMDHSKKFWHEVSEVFPHHRIQKKWLRNNSHLLNYLTDLK